LVNNDTVVESGWLRGLVDVAESDPRAGLVGSKLLFLTPFLDVALDTLPLDAGVPNGPEGATALMLHDARVVGCDYDKLMIRAGSADVSGRNLPRARGPRGARHDQQRRHRHRRPRPLRGPRDLRIRRRAIRRGGGRAGALRRERAASTRDAGGDRRIRHAVLH